MRRSEVWHGRLGPGLLSVARERAAPATKLPQTPCTFLGMATVRAWLLGPVSVTLCVLVNHREILVITEVSPLCFENRKPKLIIITVLLRIK